MAVCNALRTASAIVFWLSSRAEIRSLHAVQSSCAATVEETHGTESACCRSCRSGSLPQISNILESMQSWRASTARNRACFSPSVMRFNRSSSFAWVFSSFCTCACSAATASVQLAARSDLEPHDGEDMWCRSVPTVSASSIGRAVDMLESAPLGKGVFKAGTTGRAGVDKSCMKLVVSPIPALVDCEDVWPLERPESTSPRGDGLTGHGRFEPEGVAGGAAQREPLDGDGATRPGITG
mmetsp:Transcript_26778/g.61728  ORF Transcript_26778/g.61728 Transcript_26778/m.61728 type:complete len:239 (-) Transcript_26778:599-1315(-)